MDKMQQSDRCGLRSFQIVFGVECTFNMKDQGVKIIQSPCPTVSCLNSYKTLGWNTITSTSLTPVAQPTSFIQPELIPFQVPSFMLFPSNPPASDPLDPDPTMGPFALYGIASLGIFFAIGLACLVVHYRSYIIGKKRNYIQLV